MLDEDDVPVQPPELFDLINKADPSDRLTQAQAEAIMPLLHELYLLREENKALCESLLKARIETKEEVLNSLEKAIKGLR